MQDLILRKNLPNIFKDYENELSPLTVANYLRTWDEMLSHVNKPVNEITKLDMQEYRKHLETTGYTRNDIKYDFKIRSITSKLFSIQSVFQAYVDKGLLTYNPVKDLKKKSQSLDTKDISIDIGDIMVIMKSPTNRTSVIITMFAKSGIRVAELIGIKQTHVEDYQHQCKRVYILGKGKKERYIFIGYELYNKIKNIFNTTSEYLFHTNSGKQMDRRNVYKMINKYFENHTTKHCGCHMIRHYWADYMLNVLKKSSKAVSRYLGHSSERITHAFYNRKAKLKPADVI